MHSGSLSISLSAMASTAASSCAIGTTWLTSPHSRAFFASIGSHSRSISRARRSPMISGRNCVAPAAAALGVEDGFEGEEVSGIADVGWHRVCFLHEGLVVGHADGFFGAGRTENVVKFAGLEAAEIDGVPEVAGDVAAELVTAGLR